MTDDYARIAHAIRYIETEHTRQPELADIAAELGLSPFHCQRLFQRWAGLTPKRFLQCLTVEYAKQVLTTSNVLDTSLQAGLSGPARLHDHFVALEAVTPGEFKQRGAGLTIRYGSQPSPFGPLFVALTERGICALRFSDEPEQELAELRAFWQHAVFCADPVATAAVAEQLFCRQTPTQPLTVLVRGTNFQVQVWRALLSIPPGRLCSYEHIAQAIGRPKAVRAVGQAVGANPVAYLIPCHRVIRSSGLLSGYRWGTARKRALIAWEAGTTAAADYDLSA